jgi:hypothetical protein
MRLTRLVLLSSAVGLLGACGGDLCSQQSPCPNDPKLTEQQIQECRDATKDGAKCAAEQKAARQCINDHTTCNSSGVTDGAKLSAACQTQYDALTQCLVATP